MRRMLLCLGTGGLFLACPAVVIAQNVIIKCTRPCSSVIQAVESNGGVVTYRYRYVDAIAADLRGTQALNAVRQVVEPGELRKDFEVALPPTDGRTGSIPPALNVEAGPGAPLDAGMLAETVAEPNAYLINNLAMNLAPLHGNQILGQGMKVAVIDSGLRPNFPHLTLDGSVIGGEDFVGDGLGYNNAANSGHGTFVAGMISANVAFTIGGALRTAIATYCPSCVLPASPTTSVLPVVGSAPSSEHLRHPNIRTDRRSARVASQRRLDERQPDRRHDCRVVAEDEDAREICARQDRGRRDVRVHLQRSRGYCAPRSGARVG